MDLLGEDVEKGTVPLVLFPSHGTGPPWYFFSWDPQRGGDWWASGVWLGALPGEFGMSFPLSFEAVVCALSSGG